MKIISITTIGLLLHLTTLSQKKEGTITYVKKQNMHRSINEEMKAYVQEYRTTKHVLIYNETSSIYKSLIEEEAPQPNSNGGMTVRFGSTLNDEIFIQFMEKRKVSSRDLFGEQFLIIDSLKNEKWKLTTETKIIAGKICRKALLAKKIITQNIKAPFVGNEQNNKNNPSEKEIVIIAWYAEELSIPAGPDNYCGLPGIILEMDIDNGATLITAIEISSKVDNKLIKEPKKGKKVSPEGFQKAMTEIMQNLNPGGNRAGGGL